VSLVDVPESFLADQLYDLLSITGGLEVAYDKVEERKGGRGGDEKERKKERKRLSLR
jgi:hypothetical protein